MEHQKMLVLDFGGQYNQLIARRVRDLGVYAEVKPYSTPIETIKAQGYIGIIFTGGPNSVYEEKSPKYSSEIFGLGIPVLGICYGAQLMAHLLGGEVKAAPVREYGKTAYAICMPCSFILKCSTPPRATGCSGHFFTMFARQKVTGRWIPLWRKPLQL